MKKIALLCAMALVLTGLCVPQVYAGDITIPDTIWGNLIGGTTGNSWWDNQNEINETEPGTQTTHKWDLQTFQQTNNTTISMTGGYNFSGNTEGTIGGDLFIAAYNSVFVAPGFGSTVPAQTNPKTNVYGYNFVVVANAEYTHYNVYAITAATGITPNDNFAFSDPYKAVLTGLSAVGGGNLIATNNGLDGDNLIYTLAYDGLLGQLAGFGGPNAYAFLHYTYSCGNDFMMGNASGANVPIPPSALLLGSGLLGLVGLGWRRRKTSV